MEHVEPRSLYQRTFGRAFAFSVNMLGRTLRHAGKNVKRFRRRVYHQGRYTTAGRAMLAV